MISGHYVPKLRAVKVITYDSEGNKMIYRYGDPKGNTELGLEVEYEADQEEVMNGFLESDISFYKTGPQSTTFKIRH